MLTLECTARSERGRRADNEDAVFATRRLAAVADGVGGAAAGEVASRWAIHALVQELIDHGHLGPARARRHPRRSLVLRALDGGPDRAPAVETLAARAGGEPAWPPAL